MIYLSTGKPNNASTVICSTPLPSFSVSLPLAILPFLSKLSNTEWRYCQIARNITGVQLDIGY